VTIETVEGFIGEEGHHGIRHITKDLKERGGTRKGGIRNPTTTIATITTTTTTFTTTTTTLLPITSPFIFSTSKSLP